MPNYDPRMTRGFAERQQREARLREEVDLLVLDLDSHGRTEGLRRRASELESRLRMQGTGAMNELALELSRKLERSRTERENTNDKNR